MEVINLICNFVIENMITQIEIDPSLNPTRTQLYQPETRKRRYSDVEDNQLDNPSNSSAVQHYNKFKANMEVPLYQNFNSSILDELHQNSLNLIENSEKILQQLANIKVTIQAKQNNLIYNEQFNRKVHNEVKQKINKNLENITNKQQCFQSYSTSNHTDFDTYGSHIKLDEDDSNNENLIIPIKRNLRVGLSKYRSAEHSKQWKRQLDNN